MTLQEALMESGCPTSQSLGVEGHWLSVKDGDPRARAIYERHYSVPQHAYSKRRTIFVAPGQKMVLITVTADALFVWSKELFFGDKTQSGVNCAVFRNEGTLLSSMLVEEACELAWARWPGQRLFTYVWDAKVKSANPGYCFKKAGWRTCGRNKDGRLTILERLP